MLWRGPAPLLLEQVCQTLAELFNGLALVGEHQEPKPFSRAGFLYEQMLDIWGMTKSKNGLIVENANVQPASFALLFEVDGDTTGRKYVLYNCSATRPGINANTKSETTDPDTQTSTITVSPMADGTIKAHTADDVTPATLNGWYTSVTLPTDAT